MLIGWWGLLLFLTLGIVLETLHGLKTEYYVDPSHSTRRLVWILAHSHGTLFSLINIAFALSLSHARALSSGLLRNASAGLLGGLLLLPLGFFLSGVKLYGGDPGLGILLVPVGAIALLVGVASFLYALARRREGGN